MISIPVRWGNSAWVTQKEDIFKLPYDKQPHALTTSWLQSTWVSVLECKLVSTWIEVCVCVRAQVVWCFGAAHVSPAARRKSTASVCVSLCWISVVSPLLLPGPWGCPCGTDTASRCAGCLTFNLIHLPSWPEGYSLYVDFSFSCMKSLTIWHGLASELCLNCHSNTS